MPRPRAPKACLRCRARKVRCDVSISGIPCRNCDLDHMSCAVAERMSKRRLPTNKELNTNSPTNVIIPRATADKETSQTPSELVWDSQPDLPLKKTKIQSTSQASNSSNDTNSSPGQLVLDFSPAAQAKPKPSVDKAFGLNVSPINFPKSIGTIKPSTSRQCRSTRADCLKPSEYPFIQLPDLSRMPAEDVDCLSLQGCLQLPPRLILDEFVRHYFLYVHPIVPLLDEGHFWDIYCDRLGDGPEVERIPIVVFQAMLFVSCSFVPRNITDALGFDCPRVASAAFYKRAKLLFDLNTESSPIALAQAALLLTYWPTSVGIGPTKPNTIWLGIAIHHAMSIRAHRMFDRPGLPPGSIPQSKQIRTLRRLWWCCIFRDRVLSLGLRRNIQITTKYPSLEAEDFEHEINRSLVHEPSTKRHLVGILLRLLELFVVLTDLLPLLSLSDESLEEQQAANGDTRIKLADCQLALTNWYSKTRQMFPLPRKGNEFRHQSVIVHTNMMYIYYHAAKLGLHHQEVLVGTCLSPTGSMDPATIHKSRHEVRKATMKITDRLKESMQLGLVRYFPISIVALIAMPLLLLILDVKLQAPKLNSERASLRQECLRTLVQAMNEYHLQYHGVDLISHTIHHVVDLAQLDPALRSSGERMGWTDAITHRPSQYLRLTLVMDLSLKHAKLPETYEFPGNLQHLLCDRMGDAVCLPWNSPNQVQEASSTKYASSDDKDAEPEVIELSHSPTTASVLKILEPSLISNELDSHFDPLATDDFSFELAADHIPGSPLCAPIIEDLEATGENDVDWDSVITGETMTTASGASEFVPNTDGDQVEEFVSMLFEMADTQDNELFQLEKQASPSHQWLGPPRVEMTS
ncbi:fungal-specific transcription factor domain-containing protein [Dactylonectria macrodidyma]|uniref:Fungal-specific transcription factor domain-containing protein n=1 Tax=Dactylonectria macrodidyma TaxID=307937 RepID=A0A9P9FP02_9HYPO|nr:fungal-specific transcription factor domain-containing protein [Dactylonectria macrodidyma]